ncbi:MAG: hypothetical protein EZS28_040862, partial [Streblomastix strix]
MFAIMAKQNKFKLVLVILTVLVLYFILFGYPIFRCLWWILDHFISKTWYFYFICIAVPIFLDIIALICTAIGFSIQSVKTRYFNHISTDYIIFVIILLPLIIICEFIFDFSSAALRYAWIVCIILLGICALYIILAHLNGALIMRKKNIYLKSTKIKQSLRIIHISDIHIG